MSNRAYVELLFENVLGRPGAQTGVDFWTGNLDAGRMPSEAVLVSFANSPENRNKTEPVFGTFVQNPDGNWDYDINGNSIGDSVEPEEPEPNVNMSPVLNLLLLNQ